MGSYPSADLVYGIDLGMTDESPDWPWYTDELEKHGGPGEILDHLLQGVEGVQYDSYGNLNTGYTGYNLCTQRIHVTAYEAQPVNLAQLTGTVEDDAKLRAAWAVLYPDQLMPEPRWLIVVSYG